MFISSSFSKELQFNMSDCDILKLKERKSCTTMIANVLGGQDKKKYKYLFHRFLMLCIMDKVFLRCLCGTTEKYIVDNATSSTGNRFF